MIKKEWLLSPYTLISAVVIGILYGQFFSAHVYKVELISTVFFNALGMCILPLIFFSMVSSFAKATRQREEIKMIRLFFTIALVATTCTATLGTLAALCSEWFGLVTEESKVMIGKMLLAENSHIPNSEIESLPQNAPMINFLNNLVPPNIFKKVIEGQYLPVLFFSCLLGVALGLTKQATTSTIEMLDSLYLAVLCIIQGFMYFLPFALVSIFAVFVSEHSLSVLGNIAKMMGALYAVVAFVFVLQTLFVSRVCKIPIFQLLNKIKRPLLIGFTTTSSIAALPTAINTLEEKLNVRQEVVQTTAPLSLFFNQQGAVCFSAFITVFIATLFKIPLSLDMIIVIILGSIFLAIAMSGAPFIAVISLFAIPFAPLGITVESVVILILVASLVSDPFTTLIDVSSSLTVIPWINKKVSQSRSCLPDAAQDISVPLTPSASEQLIPSAATVPSNADSLNQD